MMRLNSLLLLIVALGGAPLDAQVPYIAWADQWEVQVVQPRETSPARYTQVDESEIRMLAAAGWQLVSVAPYVLLNEERGPEGNKESVTQTYPAYYLQRPQGSRVAWEITAVLPREISPARYAQVSEGELNRMAEEGWQLVSVAPYVLLNEERGPEDRRESVTQTYPAYYFQRSRPATPIRPASRR